MNFKLFLIISTVFLISCGGRQVVDPEPDVQIVTKWVVFDCGTPPDRDFVDLSVPRWRIIDGRYTLTPEEYGILGESVSDIIKAAKQMANVIDFYQECIDSANRSEDQEHG